MTQIVGDTQHVPSVRTFPITAQQPDERWTPTTQEETAVIAHLRGWCHLGTLCRICQVEESHRLDRATLESIVTGR